MLLHGGEFGAGAELGWERTIGALAGRHRVLAPDMLGYGDSAKVLDFVDGRGMRIRHVARFCEVLGVDRAHFVGNSMGAINLLTDVTSDAPALPVRSLALICGGGAIQRNEHADALYDYDGSFEAHAPHRHGAVLRPRLRRPTTNTCRRRHESSIAPGAWEAIAAARFRRPGVTPPPAPSTTRAYERITVPTLVHRGRRATSCCRRAGPPTSRGGSRGGRSAVVDAAGHCPQLERPDVVNALLLGLSRRESTS